MLAVAHRHRDQWYNVQRPRRSRRGNPANPRFSLRDVSDVDVCDLCLDRNIASRNYTAERVE